MCCAAEFDALSLFFGRKIADCVLVRRSHSLRGLGRLRLSDAVTDRRQRRRSVTKYCMAIAWPQTLKRLLTPAQAKWATADLVVAQRQLLAVALQEPRNARFHMASDSCVPLYPPAAVHAALLGDPRSRVAACRPTWEDNFPASG